VNLFVINQLKITAFMLTIAIGTTIFLSNHYVTREIILITAGLIVLCIFYRTIRNVNKQEREGIINFFLFMISSIAFWSIYMLGPTFLPIFIDGGIDTELFGIMIPPQWFHMLCPLTSVTVGIILSQKIGGMIKHEKSSIRRTHLFMLGLMCTVFALFILCYIVKKHSLGVHSDCLWLVAYIIFLAIGEISLAPASMALVGDYIPEKYQGIYTGITQMTIGLSVILSGVILQKLLLPAYELEQSISSDYISNFIYLAGVVSLVVVMLFVFDKRFKNRVA
jgi:dipeptide/tripeptide permease